MSLIDDIRRAREAAIAARPTVPAPTAVGGGNGQEVGYFLLQAVYDDYLVGHRIEWTDGGPEYTEDETDVLIAKPFELQKQWYHGLTIASRTYNYTGSQARTVTIGEDSEEQIIVPIYQPADGDFAGDIIVADYMPGGTGVVVDEEQVIWQERNGRGYVSEDTE